MDLLRVHRDGGNVFVTFQIEGVVSWGDVYVADANEIKNSRTNAQIHTYPLGLGAGRDHQVRVAGVLPALGCLESLPMKKPPAFAVRRRYGKSTDGQCEGVTPTKKYVLRDARAGFFACRLLPRCVDRRTTRQILSETKPVTSETSSMIR